VDLDAAEVTLGGSTAVVRGQRIGGTTKGGRSRTVSLDSDPWRSSASTAASGPKNGLPLDRHEMTQAAWSSSPAGENPSTPTP